MEKILLDLILDLHLGQWTIAVLAIVLLWHFVFKAAFESWLRNLLETQKEIVIKQAEFEQIKLERVLPLLENINSALNQHAMMFSTYTSAIINKSMYPNELEKLRLKQDKKITNAISSISIYLPSEFRILLHRIRKVISCSWHNDPVRTHRALTEDNHLSIKDVLAETTQLYNDLIDCFYSMCSKYIGASDHVQSYEDILSEHNLDNNAITTRKDPISQLALKYLLLHEYYNSNEIEEAWSDLK
jgi:hypothetical protein